MMMMRSDEGRKEGRKEGREGGSVGGGGIVSSGCLPLAYHAHSIRPVRSGRIDISTTTISTISITIRGRWGSRVGGTAVCRCSWLSSSLSL